MEAKMQQSLTDKNKWQRILYMILFVIAYSIAEIVLTVVVIVQAVIVLFTDKKNPKLLAFGGQLAAYVYQLFRFLTYNSEKMPFPFGDWPEAEVKPEES
jgi:hypothetical protein